MMLQSRGASKDPDDAIRATDDDAAASRLSAINLGYLSDSYTTILYKPQRPAPGQPVLPVRKPPLINVGTHHRTYAIDQLVGKFLDSLADGKGQIVSLGAGSDSRFWRIRSGRHARLKRYVEIDFPHVTSLKAQRISRSPKLSSALTNDTPSITPSITSSTPSASAHSSNVSTSNTTPASSKPISFLPTSQPPSSSTSFSMPPPPVPSKSWTVSKGGTSLKSDPYLLLPLDLRTHPSETLQTELLPHLDPSLPTLFLAECVFCYMSPELSEGIIRWFGETFTDVAGVVYEMCGLTDTFGQVMRRNLAARNLSIPGSAPFPDVPSQGARFVSDVLGTGKFRQSGAKSLWDIRGEVIPPDELQRIAKLEMLDEIEELRLVLSHYCVAWGTKGDVLAGVSL